MKLKRKHLVTLFVVAILASCLGVLYYRATVPFDTAHQFIRHIHAHRFDAAKSMIAPDDLGKLPPEYWDRLANTEFNDDIGWSMSSTPESLLHSVVDSGLMFPTVITGIEIRQFSITQVDDS